MKCAVSVAAYFNIHTRAFAILNVQCRLRLVFVVPCRLLDFHSQALRPEVCNVGFDSCPRCNAGYINFHTRVIVALSEQRRFRLVSVVLCRLSQHSHSGIGH